MDGIWSTVGSAEGIAEAMYVLRCASLRRVRRGGGALNRVEEGPCPKLRSVADNNVSMLTCCGQSKRIFTHSPLSLVDSFSFCRLTLLLTLCFVFALTSQSCSI